MSMSDVDNAELMVKREIDIDLIVNYLELIQYDTVKSGSNIR